MVIRLDRRRQCAARSASRDGAGKKLPVDHLPHRARRQHPSGVPQARDRQAQIVRMAEELRVNERGSEGVSGGEAHGAAGFRP